MSWYDDKKLSLGVDAIGWNSIKKKTSIQKKKNLSYIYLKRKNKTKISSLHVKKERW